jgi:hypothetical protein
MEDEYKFNLQLKTKVEIDFLRFLCCRNETKTNALTYYRDAFNLYPNKLNLFKYSIVYLHFASMLRDPLETLANKLLVLEMVGLVVNSPDLCRKLA